MQRPAGIDPQGPGIGARAGSTIDGEGAAGDGERRPGSDGEAVDCFADRAGDGVGPARADGDIVPRSWDGGGAPIRSRGEVTGYARCPGNGAAGRGNDLQIIRGRRVGAVL